jgi:ubiquinone/menaquinone biosynthesis C-methylase UbiE
MESFRREGAAAYRSPEIAKAYDARPPYPPEAIDYLLYSTISHLGESQPHRILDAGTGSGLVTEGILSSGWQPEIVALDQSDAMVTAFRRRIDETDASTVIGDFNAMPFAENSFDLVVFGTALHWGDSDSLPAELHRILRPGGCIATINNSIPLTQIFSHFRNDRIVFQNNPITQERQTIDLGPAFSSRPELFREFPHESTMTTNAFYQFLKSIELFYFEKDAAEAAWNAAAQYVGEHQDNGHITIPVNTMIRVATKN